MKLNESFNIFYIFNILYFKFQAPRDLAEAAYLTATNSLVLTNFCVKFSSEKIACFCIYLACKWTGLIVRNVLMVKIN